MQVLNSRGIEFNSRDNLVKVDPRKRIATFQVVDSSRKPTDQFKEIEVLNIPHLNNTVVQYNLLHVGPPCSPIEPLRKMAKDGDSFTDAAGWVSINEKTLQSKMYKNVFAAGNHPTVFKQLFIGDCISSLNKKTAAAAGY